MVRYSKDDLQQILRTVLDFKPLTPFPAPVVAVVLHYESPRERPLKARFPDIHRGKVHLECYNFFQKCKDHFTSAGSIGSNRVPFGAIFLKNTALFRWRQLQRKIEDQTNVLISWKGFKAFICESLGESKAFVNTVWSTIRKDSQHQLKEVIDWATHLKH